MINIPLEAITAIGISFASIHTPYSGQNQTNPGIHLEIDNARMGYYRNSRNDNTAYVGYSLPILDTRTIRVGVMVALCSGYNSPVCGGVEFVVGQHLAVMVVPPVKFTRDDETHDSPLTFGFALRFPL
jgi:hypothetical protein